MKVIDPMGEMLTAAWEDYATQFANAEQEDLLNVLQDVIKKEAINMNQEASVFVGKDTRYDLAYHPVWDFTAGLMTMPAFELRTVRLTTTLIIRN